MLFQPTNVIPSALSGEGNGTIDATKALVISWQVNGNSPMVAYRIQIMKNNEQSDHMLDSGKVTLSTPFFGTDALGRPRRYSHTFSASLLAATGIVNGYEKGYKFTIKQWWSATGAIEQTSASFFITRATPSLTLQTIPYRNSFRQQEHTFEAFYSQAQDDAVEWYRWELQARTGRDYETVDDTGYIYNGGMVTYGSGSPYYGMLGIQYTYNGFVIGTSGALGATGIPYRIRCTVQTENGVQASTGWEEFTTQNIYSDNANLRLCTTKETDAVQIRFPKNFPLQGQPNGSYSLETLSGSWSSDNYVLNLPSGSSMTWGGIGLDSLDITVIPHSIFVKMNMTSVSSASTFFSADYGGDTLSFSYNSSGFKIQYAENELWHTSISPAANTQAAIILTNSKVYFGLNNSGTVQYEETSIPSWQKNGMDSLTLHGPGKFLCAWVQDGELTGSTAASYVYSLNSVPYPTNYTQFLVTFRHNTIYSGGDLLSEDVRYFSIYRKGASSSLFKLIASVPFDEQAKDTVIYDYSARNQERYEYYFLNAKEDYYVNERNGIAGITPCFWNYTVLCCNQDNNGDYIVDKEYRFALDIASGNVGNNNGPALQNNFTRYPFRQPVSNNYRSGSLSAFIGKVKDGQYVDSVNLMDELYELSTNAQTKFLKTRKGHLFQIEVSAPISMNIGDKYAQQPAKISLPWVEIADASNANILGNQAMSAPMFHVDMSTMNLLMSYNVKSSMGADSFRLSEGDLLLLNSGSYNENDFSLNSNREVILNTD